jgi:putative addiction module CopG family antidote
MRKLSQTMMIHLKPELEAFMRNEVNRGAYKSTDEFVERAIQLLHDHEQWLSENQPEIAELVDQGYASAVAGNLLDPEQVRARMADQKTTWRDAKLHR